MFYPYLHSTKKSFLTFINQPCCFIRWPTFLQPRHQPKTGPQRSAPIARSWIRWGDLSWKISRDKFFGFKGCWRLTNTKTPGGSGGFFIFRQWWGQLRPREDVSGHVGTSLFKKPLKKAKYVWFGAFWGAYWGRDWLIFCSPSCFLGALEYIGSRVFWYSDVGDILDILAKVCMT